MRITAFDVLTNLPIVPPPSINTYFSPGNPATGLSPLTIPNVSTGTSVFTTSRDNSHLFAVYSGSAKDVMNDGIMDITLAMSPIMVR